MSGKWRTLSILALAELFAMSLWFSATAVTPNLTTAWDLTTGQVAWLTMAVQLGFVVGALLVAVTNVADLFPPRFVFAGGALAGAAANAAIAALSAGPGTAVPLRFLTGVTLAAVYPVGMKIMATWTREDRGLGIGLLVGALTVGSASPHLIRALGGIENWAWVMYASSGLALAAAVVVAAFGHTGPHHARAPRFRWNYLTRALTDRPLRLANLGYFGHMWELYAMWTWIPTFLLYAFADAPPASWPARIGPATAAALVAFAVIGVGGISSLLAGRLADRWGRTRTTILSMVLSGTCAMTIGLLPHGAPSLIVLIALAWGFTVIADSAQFSSAVSELGEPEYMGTMLTTQTALGFVLTLASIRLVPVIVEHTGWWSAFAVLAVGPVLGSLAMWRLQRSPAASRLAGGRG